MMRHGEVPDHPNRRTAADAASPRASTVSPLVGRTVDLAAVSELAQEHRLVTITGPGGIGKTRIVIELGRLLAPEFLDGVARSRS
jgi:ATP/maltotriose-dependent transcriptional regulator MalT